MHQQFSESIDAADRIDLIARRLEKLRFAYEQYFLGVDRTEPQQEKAALKTMLNDLRRNPIRNTAVRFRLNQLIARLNSFSTYWARVTRQIEEGTYQRDIKKARRRMQVKSTSTPGTTTTDERLSNRLSDNQADTTKKDHPNLSKNTPSALQNGLTNQQIEKLHKDYTNARLSLNEPIKGITKEVVGNSLRKQIPTIIKQYKCKSVAFKVIVKNGKAIIKAVPKS